MLFRSHAGVVDHVVEPAEPVDDLPRQRRQRLRLAAQDDRRGARSRELFPELRIREEGDLAVAGALQHMGFKLYATVGTARFLAEKGIECEPVYKVREGRPDVVQISGGEPTIHPLFFEILDLCRARPIKHLMVNTNGLRIAQDEAFARRLATYREGFEVYLQFDSFRRDALLALRGADLRPVRERALDRLNALDISTTLVVTVMKGQNDDELGEIVEFALHQPCVRGVTFQPIQAAGRLEGYDESRNRLTLTEVRRRILEQTSTFRPEDIIPVPCHPDNLAMAYAIKVGDQVMPLTGMIEPEEIGRAHV